MLGTMRRWVWAGTRSKWVEKTGKREAVRGWLIAIDNSFRIVYYSTFIGQVILRARFLIHYLL
jgi:hypothetical protein